MGQRRLFSVADMLEMVPRSRTQLYRDMASGLLEYVQAGSRRYFEPQCVDRYIDALKTARPATSALLDLIDENGLIDVARIPEGVTIADIAELKRIVAERSPQAAA